MLDRLPQRRVAATRLLALLSIAALTSTPAAQGLCQESNGLPQGPSSFSKATPADTLFLGSTALESLTLAAGETVEKVAWRGFIADNPNNNLDCPGIAFDFTINLYADIAGAPDFGAGPVFTKALGGGVDPTDTGDRASPFASGIMRPVIQCTALLQPGFTAPSAGTYWLEVVHTTPPNPNNCGWWWRTAPPGDGVSYAKNSLFGTFATDFDLDICVNATLDAPIHVIQLADGGVQGFGLDAGPDHANELYWILGTATGTSPGQPLPGVPGGLQLNLDNFFLFSVLHPNTLIPQSLAFLDTQGSASTSLTLPAGLDPSLAFVKLHHAYITLDANFNATLSSNAVPLTLKP